MRYHAMSAPCLRHYFTLIFAAARTPFFAYTPCHAATPLMLLPRHYFEDVIFLRCHIITPDDAAAMLLMLLSPLIRCLLIRLPRDARCRRGDAFFFF